MRTDQDNHSTRRSLRHDLFRGALRHDLFRGALRRRATRAMLALASAGLVVGSAGCSPTGMIVGAGATAGVTAVQERSLGDAVDDARIQLAINDLWLQHSVDMYTRLGLAVTEGRVLVTGAVPTPDMRLDAIRLAWQPEGVRQVINEVTVADGGGLPGFTRDAWISAQLRLRLTFDREVSAINYSVETVRGAVYLMGIARDREELQRVVDQARNLRYVRRVVSHVRLVRSSAKAGGATSKAAGTANRCPPANAGDGAECL